ncbi:TerC family protein [Halalkalibacillus halophilus]|uniref:TerC family protein n=1 Tax=Halalkalibacillus halophilus TaxID=392827 RepID=UPI000409B3A4|nr:TerC family protein [Halalkalibacillus halophilus]
MEILLDIQWDLVKAILIIIGIDLILGGDNAIVIAMASKNLPRKHQRRAIIIGTSLAISIRFILATLAVFLLTLPYIQLIGGLFLLVIAVKLLVDHQQEQDIHSSTTLFGAVKTIVIADVVMGFDNVLAISAAANQNIFLILFGLIVSVPIIIFGSSLLLKLMDKYSFISYLGASLLAYTSAELIIKEEVLSSFVHSYTILHLLLPILFIVFVITIGLIKKKTELCNIARQYIF